MRFVKDMFTLYETNERLFFTLIYTDYCSIQMARMEKTPFKKNIPQRVLSWNKTRVGVEMRRNSNHEAEGRRPNGLISSISQRIGPHLNQCDMCTGIVHLPFISAPRIFVFKIVTCARRSGKLKHRFSFVSP